MKLAYSGQIRLLVGRVRNHVGDEVFFSVQKAEAADYEDVTFACAKGQLPDAAIGGG